ncbi:hypothetical protein [Cellulophaga baltica]|uniref:hypothetical protein n=1 Tax=Cellulophaga baltica TaxID=76594 RepID=UPI00041D9086|nr:hypothetical protein [Cellulophaga baltica]
MKTLEESIEYTTNKKKNQISRLENSHFHQSIEDLKLFLETGKGIGSSSLKIEYLGAWYHWNFIYKYLVDQEIKYDLLSASTYYNLECNNWCYFLGKWKENFKSATSFTKSIKHLGQMLYLGQKEDAIQYGYFLLKMLYGKQYDGWIVFPTHPWFLLELFCRWQNINLDYEKLNYPNNLGVYQSALDNWNTIDTQLLSDNIDSLTKFHIAQSDEDEQGNANDENGDGYDLEFTSADYFIFPIEILMWLAIRRDLGLPEYRASSQNKLMQMEINQLPTKKISKHEDTLIEKCKNKLMQENPDITFEL